MTCTYIVLIIINMKTTLIRNIPDKLWQQFKVKCAKENVSMNQQMLNLVQEYVKQKGSKRE